MSQSRTIHRLGLIGCVVALLGTAPVWLWSDEKPKADAAGSEWSPLFDGKSFDGWRNWKKKAIHPDWKIVDGAISKGKGGGDLETVDEFDYFELTIDYKIEPRGNSGIMYWVQDEGTEPGWSGPEVQVLDNKDGGDPTRAGWLYGIYHPADDPKTGKPIDATHPAGEWNTLRIIVAPAGEVSSIWMNGVKYEEWVFGSDDWKARVAKSKFGPAPLYAKRQKGHIVLQDHGAAVAFREIKIRPWKKRAE